MKVIPKKILGKADHGGLVEYLMEWENWHKKCFVPSAVARRTCPQLVIDFYEAQFMNAQSNV